MTIVDQPQRARALEVNRSFCVTAPAGSGKTELLIQRYLALLPRVERPEQVLAITFTRKAAAEMRERVMSALGQAAARTPCDEPHQQRTRDLARAALDAGERRGWHLRRDYSRLNIKTIDSFCAGLTRQMPVLSAFGGPARAVDQAEELYREAVADLLILLGTEQPVADDLAAVLLHFDNNAGKLETLLVEMLARRDQWIPYMGSHHRPEEAQQSLAATVEAVVAETLAPLSVALAPYAAGLEELIDYSLANRNLVSPGCFPRPVAADTEGWRQLRELLLTTGSRGSWRQRLDVRQGFPKGEGEPRRRKQQHADLVAQLAQLPGIEEALRALDSLPRMSDNSHSWQLVLHLSRLLPTLSALLLLVFQRRGVVDHSQVAQAALRALGEDEQPTDLAQRLDYCIEHILVDEFQDTAINQYRLVQRLTRGWSEYNHANSERPRTLFIVGDAMQSIYGFRDANIGLFLYAQRYGFNGVVPEPLQLLCNFRSQSGLVEWVNEAFSQAFPAQDNIRLGEVSYTPAAAIHPAGDRAPVLIHAFCGEQAEAQEAAHLVQSLKPLLQDDEVKSVAILGRSRSQLAPVLRELRAEGIAYGAQDIDALAGSPPVMDLVSLCRALANPADRVAWFALLRGPWCGLEPDQLLRLAQAGEAPRYCNPWLLLEDGVQAAFPPDARERLAALREGLCWARARWDRLALRAWIEQTWLRLGGPASVADPGLLRDVERFFELLQEADQAGVGLDLEWLRQRLDSLYADGVVAGAKLQVMTLHKAKGLEFDHVFIPALARGTRAGSRPLLAWEEYNGPDGERGYLLAADDHSEAGEPSLYNFIRERGKRRERLENTRLLYVGATRAVRQLTLSACLALDGDEDWQPGQPLRLRKPGEGTLLAPIWDRFTRQMQVHEPLPAPATAPAASGTLLSRLRQLPGRELAADAALPVDPNIPPRQPNRLERHVGTVVHLALEELSARAPLPDSPGAGQIERWSQALRELGLEGTALAEACRRVEAAVQATLDDGEYGRWLLAADQAEAASELPLTLVEADGRVRDIVIDRTFVDRASGVRWVVDYKTSQPAPGESYEVFAAAEADRYREQLQMYRDALAKLERRETRCALYFACLGRLQALPELDLSPD